MGGKRNCLLSVAMIVKDEEHNIRRALDSVKDVVDEIIVVDTGSKDRTPEIVKKYTDKLYFHEWKNDFSEARNYSLQFPTCEWVLILDADEELSEEFKRNIRNFLESLPKDVNTVYVPALSYLDWDFKKKEIASTARIFRNGTVYYKNIVHNQPVHKGKVVDFNKVIIHYGYIWTRSLRKKKYERTKNLILKHLKSEKDSKNRIYYLVQLYKTEIIGGKRLDAMRLGMEILDELKKVRKVPGITMEFLYLFGSLCAQFEYYDLAEKALSMAVKAFPDYPDPYFGMIIMYERKDNIEKIKEWSDKFIEVMEKALQNTEKFKITLITVRYIQLAWFFKAYSELKFGLIDEFKKSLKKALSMDIVEDVSPVLNKIIFYISNEASVEAFNEILEIVKEIHDFALKNGIKVPIDLIFERIAKEKLDVDKGILKEFKPESITARFIKDKLLTGKDFIKEYLFLGRNEEEFVNQVDVPGILLLYEINRELGYSPKELLKFLNRYKSFSSKAVSGVSHALMGDNFIKLGNFNEAIRNYRKAIELVPELGEFIKPVIEDLMSKPSKDTEGSYEEILKFYMKHKEFFVDFKIFTKDSLKYFHLISDIPIAKYISALYISDIDKSIELLESIPEEYIKVFPMYYHRLAQFWKKKSPEKAIDIYQKSLEENAWLADIVLKKFPFNGIYPAITKAPFFDKNDDIIWIENISERFSPLGAIHPIKIWRQSRKGFLYSQPFPSDSAIKLYYKREKEVTRVPIFELKEDEFLNILFRYKINKIYMPFSEYIRSFEVYKKVAERARTIIDDKSETSIILKPEILKPDELEDVIERYKTIVINFRYPSNENSNIWYYPPFRILITPMYVENLAKKYGKTVEEVYSLTSENFVAVVKG